MFDEQRVRAVYQQGLAFADFVATGSAEGYDAQWRERHGRLALDDAQQHRVAAFDAPMRVLCLTGVWCGDCALQGAALQRIAEAAPAIELRFAGRNDHPELQVRHPINGGYRVPVTFVMTADLDAVARLGDRTLSRYRSMARKALGGAPDLVLAPPPEDPVRAVLAEMLDEIERLQLLLALPREAV